MQTLFIILTVIVITMIAYAVWHFLSTRLAVSDRIRNLDAVDTTPTDARLEFESRNLSGVRGWLFRANFRNPQAELIFWASTIGLLLCGVFVWYQLLTTGTIDIATDFIRSIPGGVGNVMIPFVLAMPWFMIAVLMLLPTLVVRSMRRKRVQEIEQDLPLTLDLLNTLAQAGVGFDSALDQVLSAQSAQRPLVQELRSFQADNLAGRSRIDSLRRLMKRVSVPMFSTFISAIVQAEQVGAGIGETLKIQAAEMRARRREKASAAAMSVPTLLVVPMVVGFLPGIFVVLIGPMLYQAFGAMGQTMRGVTGQ
ncbi:MAG: type II secretion system F family protein [Pirellulaceae bacterium]